MIIKLAGAFLVAFLALAACLAVATRLAGLTVAQARPIGDALIASFMVGAFFGLVTWRIIERAER